jgi:tetratricopeptide (TPR) repeat protein
VDGAWAELADAVIHSQPNGDANRRKQALESASAKARRRGAKAEEVVLEFIKKLRAATKEHDDRIEKERTIDSNRTATMTFNGGGKRHTVKLGLKITSATQAVLLTLSQATEDIDLFVGRGQPKNPALCEHVSAGPSPNETILLSRKGATPLRVGTYTIFVVQPPSSRNRTEVKLTVRFLRPGEPEPFVWERSPPVALRTPAGAAEANRLVRLFGTKQYAAWKSGWLALETREPLAKLIRVNLLSGRSGLPPELVAPKEFEALIAEMPKLERHFPRHKGSVLEAWATAEILSGKVDEGLARLQAATARNPRQLDFYVRQINMLNHLKRYEEAAKVGETVRSRKAGEIPLALIAMARTQLALGNKDVASERIKEAVQSRLPMGVSLTAIQMLIEARSFSDALELVKTVDAKTPGMIDVNLEVRRAFCLDGMGDRAGALARLKALLSNIPPGRPELSNVINSGIKAIEEGTYLPKETKAPEKSSRKKRSSSRKKRRR